MPGRPISRKTTSGRKDFATISWREKRGGAAAQVVEGIPVACGREDAGPAANERQHAEGFLESIALSSSIPIRTHVLPGDPADAIMRVAGEIDADLIVVGNKGMKGVGRILGSVPNTIAHKTSCSVLIVSTT